MWCQVLNYRKNEKLPEKCPTIKCNTINRVMNDDQTRIILTWLIRLQNSRKEWEKTHTQFTSILKWYSLFFAILFSFSFVLFFCRFCCWSVCSGTGIRKKNVIDSNRLPTKYEWYIKRNQRWTFGKFRNKEWKKKPPQLMVLWWRQRIYICMYIHFRGKPLLNCCCCYFCLTQLCCVMLYYVLFVCLSSVEYI